MRVAHFILQNYYSILRIFLYEALSRCFSNRRKEGGEEIRFTHWFYDQTVHDLKTFI